MRAMTRRTDERGVVVILTALMLVAMLVVAALVLDIGSARSRGSSAQSAADLAALAAGGGMSAGTPRRACEAAVANLSGNVAALRGTSPTGLCAGIPVSACTTPGTTSQVSTTSGAVTLRIRYPVLDADIAVGGASGGWINDGTACQRMRIELSEGGSTTFARVMDRTEIGVTRSATIRGVVSDGTNVPALWLLDPTGCTPLNVGGGSRVTVGRSTSPPIPGVIAIDSDGSTCNSNQVTISASGTGTRLIAEPLTGSPLGQVNLFAMQPGATACSPPACNQADVDGLRLRPLPVSARVRATRAPVDWRYDCKASYPLYNGIPVEGCANGTPPYLTNLRSAIGSTGAPPGFQRWSTTYSCNPSGTITATGNWWVDCSGGLSISNGNTVTFSGGNVVIDRALNMTGGALNFNTNNPSSSLPTQCLAPNVTTPCTTSSSSTAAWVYQRSGEWKVTGGFLTVRNTAVIMDDGYLQVAGGAPPTWTAPTVGPFEGLSYWSETSSSKYSMTGGAGVQLAGVFFTPEARPFSLSGGGTWGQQAAQFISFRLSVSGGGEATLVPSSNLIGLPNRTGLLIR
jgi:Flp pilus assembly protein TadG